MPNKIFVLAGEASGDLLGGPMLEAIRESSKSPVEFIGVGGPSMETAGLKSLFPMEELSVMGAFEVIKHLPRLLRRLNQVTEYIKEAKPDVVVTIDLPDFSFRLAKKLKGLGIPHIHYTAPTVWAWRPGRAKKIAQLVDHLLCILPFEPPYFTAHGLPATFVGHMVTELGIDQIPRETFRQEHKISDKDTLLCLLPGSRTSEVERLLPIFKNTIERLKIHHSNLKVVVPTMDSVEELVRLGLQDLKVPIIYVKGQQKRYEAMRAADVALATSGTVNLELAMAQVPFVIAYKMNALSAWLAPYFVHIKYMTMVNILLDRPAVPEFFQRNVTPENLFNGVHKYLTDKKSVSQALKDQLEAIRLLKPLSGTPSQMAAEVVLGRLISD
jgi:lipid-A-disaccharide synthase